MTKNEFGYLAQTRLPFEINVTPKASQNKIKLIGSEVRVYVTMAPEAGKATAMVVKLLPKAIGVPKSKLRHLRGATSRRKLFQIED